MKNWCNVLALPLVMKLLPFMLKHMACCLAPVTPVDWIVEYHADSKGLIKRVNLQLAYDKDYPLNTLESDWDLVKQIADSIQHLPDADGLVGSFLARYNVHQLYIPHVSANPAQLQECTEWSDAQMNTIDWGVYSAQSNLTNKSPLSNSAMIFFLQLKIFIAMTLFSHWSALAVMWKWKTLTIFFN
eukprot:11408035-Ditylum_brightwellii.AAC.1